MRTRLTFLIVAAAPFAAFAQGNIQTPKATW